MNDIIVDVKKFNSLNQEFFDLIEQITSNKDNFFYLINNLDQCWDGKDQAKFVEMMKEEEKNENLFVEKIKDIYNYCVLAETNYKNLLKMIDEYINSHI